MRVASFLLISLGLTALAMAQPATRPAIVVDKEKKTVTIDAKVALRKLPNLSEVYPIEVVGSFAAPVGQKAHETIITYDAKPSEIHQALESLGLKPGKPAQGENAAPEGPEVQLFLELPGDGGQPRRVAVEQTLVDRKTGKTMPRIKWFFTGSAMTQPDPDKPEKVYGADLTGTLASVFPVTDETVIQSNLTLEDTKFLSLDTDRRVLPPEGTAVKLIIDAK